MLSTIKKLLQRRKDFMAARGLHDGASQPTGGRYLFTQKDRQQVMKEWKDEFHAAPEQVEQQKRDSWKPQGRPVGGDWGPNTAAVRNGKHSRFARHLQLEAGSKARTSGSAPSKRQYVTSRAETLSTIKKPRAQNVRGRLPRPPWSGTSRSKGGSPRAGSSAFPWR